MCKTSKKIKYILIFFVCSPNSTHLVERFPVVYNSHNVKKIVSLYSDDATFEVVGQFLLKGKNQIRDIAEYDSVLNIHMSVRNIKASGDTIFCDISETNEWLKLLEIDEAYYTAIFIFQGGLIKHIRAEAKPETQQAFNQVLSPLMKWARDNNANVLGEMMLEG